MRYSRFERKSWHSNMFIREVYRHRSGEWRATREPSRSPKESREEGCWRHWVSELQGRLWKSNRKGRKEDRNKRRKDNNVGKVKRKLPIGRALTVTNIDSHLKCAHRSMGTFATLNKTTQAQSELIKGWTGMEKKNSMKKADFENWSTGEIKSPCHFWFGRPKKLWPDQEAVTRKAALAPDFQTCAVFRASLSWNIKSKQQVQKLCFWSNETMDANRKYRSCGHEATETQKAKGERGRARTNVGWLWTDVS